MEGVAEVVRGGSTTNLCSALEMLLADGLKIKHPWDMIVTATAPGINLICGSSRYFERISVLNFKNVCGTNVEDHFRSSNEQCIFTSESVG